MANKDLPWIPAEGGLPLATPEKQGSGAFLDYYGEGQEQVKKDQREIIEANIASLEKRKATYISRQARKGLPIDEERIGHYDRYLAIYRKNLEVYHGVGKAPTVEPEPVVEYPPVEVDNELDELDELIAGLRKRQELLKRLADLKAQANEIQLEIAEIEGAL